jgi:hypothetical protein
MRVKPLTDKQLEALNFLTLPPLQRRAINLERIINGEPLHSQSTWRSLVSRGLVSRENDWNRAAKHGHLNLTDTGREVLAEVLAAFDAAIGEG